jgi:hypothetical protein
MKDKLLACPQCVSAVTKALMKGLWERALLGIEPRIPCYEHDVCQHFRTSDLLCLSIVERLGRY